MQSFCFLLVCHIPIFRRLCLEVFLFSFHLQLFSVFYRTASFNYMGRFLRLTVSTCVTSPNRRPPWSPLTSLLPPPLPRGGSTSGSPAEEPQTDRWWWLQPEPCGRTSGNHKQVTSAAEGKLVMMI